MVIPTTARPPAFEDLPPFDLGGQPTTTAVEQLGDSTLDSLDQLLPGSSTSGTSDVLPAIGGDLGGAGSIDELGGGREPPSDSDTSQLPPEGRRDQLDPQEGDPSQPASEVVTTSTLIGPDSQITDNSGPIGDQMTTVVSKDPKITSADPIRGEITTADPIIAEMTTAEASRGADTDIIGSLEPGRNLPAIESSGGGLQGAAQNSTEEEKGGEEEGDVMGTTVGGGEEEEKVDILGRESV